MQNYADTSFHSQSIAYSMLKKKVTSTEMEFFNCALAIKMGIYSGNETRLREIFTGDLLECALELLAAYNHYGMEGYWKSYDVFALTMPCLQEMRLLLRDLSANDDVGPRLSSGEDEEISWLWEPYLALGKIATLDGDPGSGKTAIAFDIAARVTAGRQMPDHMPGIAGGGGVVLITPEDGLWDCIRPRFSRAAADLHRIMSISKIHTIDPATGYHYERLFTLPLDLSLLDKAMTQVQARLVIIDPLMAILGGQSAGRDNDVRALLAPLVSLLEKHKAACIMIRHLNKNSGESNALYRGGGSMAFVGLSRSTLAVGADPTDPGRNVLVHLKTNLSEYGDSHAFCVINDRETTNDRRPYVKWDGKIDVSRKDVFTAKVIDRSSSARQEVLTALTNAYPAELTRQDLTKALPEMNKGTLDTVLKRLIEEGEIARFARGTYMAITK